MTELLTLIAKLLNIALDAWAHRNDTHDEIVKRFEAALAEGQGILDKMKAGLAANDAKADADLKAIADKLLL